MKTNRLLVALVNRRKGGVAMSATSSSKRWTASGAPAADPVTPNSAQQTFVRVFPPSTSRYSSHEEANAWTMDRRAVGAALSLGRLPSFLG